MRKTLSILALAVIGYYLIVTMSAIPFGQDRMNPDVAKVYLTEGVPKTGSVNIVTAIVVNFRGFDTLGEVTVLFLAATGLGAMLYDKRGKRRPRTEASPVVRVGARILFPLIVLLGAYVFVHGHLTPGGGFPGGVIIATGFLLMYMAYRSYDVSHWGLSITESLAGMIFVSIGLLGLIYGQSFLYNFLPPGVPNTIFSAGVIPLIYIAIGLKVGSELTGVIDNMMETIR
ncbi:MAG: cation:proton antiporter [Calditrichaeota bacterium]|nr:cation:proton antiporter [Calditrichota bacterium]